MMCQKQVPMFPQTPFTFADFLGRPEFELALHLEPKLGSARVSIVRKTGRILTGAELERGGVSNATFCVPKCRMARGSAELQRILDAIGNEWQEYAAEPSLTAPLRTEIRVARTLLLAMQSVVITDAEATTRRSARLLALGYSGFAELIAQSVDSPAACWTAERSLEYVALLQMDSPA